MIRPMTPDQMAEMLQLHRNYINRAIESGELTAIIHPEAFRLFQDSKSTHDPYKGPTAQQMIEELRSCSVVLLAEYIEGPSGAGSFFAALAGALRRADPANLHSLYCAFPRTLYGYLRDQRRWADANKREQA